MKKYVNPNVTIISLSATDVLCSSGIFPEIDNQAPGYENDTPVLPIL